MPGVQFRVRQLEYTDSAATITAEDFAEVRLKVVIHATMGVSVVDPDEPMLFDKPRPLSGGQTERFWSFCQLKFMLSRINRTNTKGITIITVCESSEELEDAYGCTRGKPADYSVEAGAAKPTSAWDGILGESWDRIAEGRLVISQIKFSLAGAGSVYQIKALVRTRPGEFGRRSVEDYRQWVRCNGPLTNSASARRLANTFIDLPLSD
jgi:hypothetical protein